MSFRTGERQDTGDGEPALRNLWGANEDCSNVTLVCHALSGSARWTVVAGLLERIFDLEHDA